MQGLMMKCMADSCRHLHNAALTPHQNRSRAMNTRVAILVLVILGVAQAMSVTTTGGALCFAPSRHGKVIARQAQLDAIKHALHHAAIVQASRAATFKEFASKYATSDAALAASYRKRAAAARAKSQTYADNSANLCNRAQILAAHLVHGSEDADDAATAVHHASTHRVARHGQRATSTRSLNKRARKQRMLRKRAVKRGRKQRVSRKHASKRGRKQRVSRKHSSTKHSQKHAKSEHKSPHSVHNKLHHSRKHAPTKRVSSAKAKSSNSIATVAKTTTKAVRLQLKKMEKKLDHEKREIALLKMKLQSQQNEKEIAKLKALVAQG